MPNSRVVRSLCVVTLLAAATLAPGVSLVATAASAAPAKPAAKAAPPADAKSGGVTGERIAAVVNDAVITASDVNARIKLALLSSGMRDSPEARENLRAQVIRQLIDEQLQIQEAKRQGAASSDADLKKAMENVAKSNKMTLAQMDKMLADAGIPKSTLSDQIRATVDWHRLTQRRVQQEVTLGDDEIQAALDREKQSVGKPEQLVAEIFLAVDRPNLDSEVRRTADRLIEEVRRTGNFAGAARQFSQGAGASEGGDLGWIRQGDLGEELDGALRTLRPGQVSAPIRSADGYHILLVRAQRTVGSSAPAQEAEAPPPPPPQQQAKPDLKRAKVNMKQIVFPAAEPTDAARKAAADLAEKVRKTIKNCGDFDKAAKASGIPESGDMGTQLVRDLHPGLQNFALGVPLGQPGPVMKGDGGAMLLIVCKRDVPMIEAPAPAAARPAPAPAPVATKKEDLRQPTREDVENRLFNEQVERVSRRYLRDLRRSAFIEMRS